MRMPAFPLLATLLVVGILAGCGGTPAEPVTAPEDARVRDALQDRSWRQFDPDRDGDPRKGVIVDFFGPVTLWAQYAEGDHAIDEWEIVADDYRIEKHGDTSEVTIRFVEPRTSRNLPAKCTNCINVQGVTISIRDYEGRGSAEFKINDPHDVLPSPFPLFGSWTRFSEDEYVNGG